MGEIVAAFFVLNTGAVINPDELRDFCIKGLGNYKIPKQFYQLNELPKTYVGKIDKNELKYIGMQLLKQNDF